MSATALLRRLGVAALLGVVFLVASLAGVFLHADLPASRRAAAELVERLLGSELRGRFEISEFERISPWVVRARSVEIFDPAGQLVIRGEGLRVRTDVFAILKELLFGDDKVTLVAEHVRLERGLVRLLPDAEGQPTIVDAFTPRQPGTGGGRVVRVWMPSIELGRGDLQGRLAFAPALDAEVVGARASVLVSAVGVAVDAPSFSAKIRGLLPSELRAVGSFHQRGTSHFWSTLDGYVGDLQYNSVLRLDGRHLEATVDLPYAAPAAVRALVPAWPLVEPVSVRATAKGDLPKLHAEATATVGGATVRATGDLELSGEPRAKLSAEGKGLDLRAFVPEAPETSLSLAATLDLHATPKGLVVEGEGKSEPSLVAGVPVPGSTFKGRYDRQGATGSVKLFEEGMPLDARVTATAGGVVDLDVQAKRFRLENAPRLRDILHARGDLEFSAKARLDKGAISGTFHADGGEVAMGEFRAGTLHATGKVNGPLAKPEALRLDVETRGSAVVFGPFVLDEATAKVVGPPSALVIEATMHERRGASAVARTRLSALGGTRFDGLEVDVSREGRTLRARAERVELAAGGLLVEGARVEGAGGTLTGSGRLRPGQLDAAAHGNDVDLDAMATILGLGHGLGGKLDVNAEVVVARDLERGTVDLTIENGRLGSLQGVSVVATGTLADRVIAGEARVRVEGLGSLRGSADVSLAGSPLEPAAYRDATGRVDLGLERLDLERLAAYLPASLPITKLRGGVTAQATVLRTDASQRPHATFLLGTDRLSFEIERASPEKPIEVSRIEAQLGGTADGATGAIEGTLRLIDQYGVLVSATARLDSDVDRLLADPRAFVAGLTSRPLVVSALVDQRRLEELPPMIRPDGPTGMLRAEVNLRGTLDDPIFAAKASLAGLVVGPEAKPFDVCGRVQFDPAERRIGFGAEVHLATVPRTPCAGRRVALADATGLADIPALLRGERGFVGNAELALDDTPLDLVPVFSQAGVAGTIGGRVALVQVNELPQLTANLRIAEGGVGSTALGSGELDVRSDGRALRALLSLERGNGKVSADGRAVLSWTGLVPTLDPAQPLSLSASVENIDAVVLGPLLRDVLHDLQGQLDGQFRVALVPLKGGAGYGGDVTGKAFLKDGSFQLRGLDMRLSRVEATAEAKRVGGRTVIFLRRVSAASRAERPNIAAAADLYLEGLTLAGGRANVNLRKVPLMLAGVSQANLTGTASLSLDRDGERMRVLVEVPVLTADLPRSAGRNVLSVDPHPDIEIVQPLSRPRARSTGETVVWELRFDLGRKVRLERADLEIPLGGMPVITLAEEVGVTGDLELKPGGRVTLLGKVFAIETGEVHFDTGDASNPHVRVLASWHAPDGTTIYVEVRGTYREATLRLDSDPPRSEQEIQALLLGGGSNEGGDTQTAGLSYGTDFLGEVLSETPLRGVQLRASNETGVDDKTYATYSAAVQVSDEIWFEGSYKSLETTGPGEQGSMGVSGIIDWRFKKNWSLRTEVGNIGAGLDLLWQYRY